MLALSIVGLTWLQSVYFFIRQASTAPVAPEWMEPQVAKAEAEVIYLNPALIDARKAA